MELKDRETIQGADYRERFKTEYHLTKTHYEKLNMFIARIAAAEITACMENAVEMPKHDCPIELLKRQQEIMAEYLHILELRSVIEDIEI